MSKIIVEHREANKMTDSLEIGTPAKGGAIKIYCDFSDIETTRNKIDNAVIARSYAQSKLSVEEK